MQPGTSPRGNSVPAPLQSFSEFDSNPNSNQLGGSMSNLSPRAGSPRGASPRA